MTYVKSFRDLEVYRLSREVSKQIFVISKGFPSEEKFSLTDQVRRSSRSVCGNLCEAWARRRYIAHFTSKTTDCDGENAETETWIDFAKDCGYIGLDIYEKLGQSIGKMLGNMINKAEYFCHN